MEVRIIPAGGGQIFPCLNALLTTPLHCGRMKIETGRISSTGPARRAERRNGQPESSFALESSGPAASPARLTGMSGPSAASAVLLAQEEDTPSEKRRRTIRRADDLLDRLDEIRLSLLSGRIAIDKLQNLRRALEQRTERADNPALQETLDAIDLRVEVELAKYHS
ncbi:MAG: flagellar assembly protein FliX [Minwuia sp.]|uniref:flagellar assembly protein FliX n=1 Tax=Minwuia sp. TaxID=2493630 RepID=UPI003A87D847